MVLEIGSHVTTMTEIYTIMTKVHYRLSNGAGSKKELLVFGLFPVHAKCYGGILVRLVMCVMVGHRKLKIEIIKLLTILC